MDDKLRAYGKKFEKIRKDNPDLTFSQFYVEEVKKLVDEKGKHTTIGANIQSSKSWKKAGIKHFKQLVEKGNITESSRVLDYGCGSLRIGQHFISFLNSGCYMGIDVTDDFIQMGLDMMDNQVVAEKVPVFGFVDSDDDIDRAVEFAPDFLFAHGVHFHIHPDELDRFYANVSRIAHRKNALFVFKAQIADTPTRYHQRGWAWPLETLQENLPDFELIEVYNKGAVDEKVNMQTCFLRFQRR